MQTASFSIHTKRFEHTPNCPRGNHGNRRTSSCKACRADWRAWQRTQLTNSHATNPFTHYLRLTPPRNLSQANKLKHMLRFRTNLRLAVKRANGAISLRLYPHYAHNDNLHWEGIYKISNPTLTRLINKIWKSTCKKSFSQSSIYNEQLHSIKGSIIYITQERGRTSNDETTFEEHDGTISLGPLHTVPAVSDTIKDNPMNKPPEKDSDMRWKQLTPTDAPNPNEDPPPEESTNINTYIESGGYFGYDIPDPDDDDRPLTASWWESNLLAVLMNTC